MQKPVEKVCSQCFSQAIVPLNKGGGSLRRAQQQAMQKIRQKSGVGKMVYNELEKRFKHRGVRIAIVDVENNNPVGVRFVEGLGFKEAESYVWFSKNIED
jgi:GNAT superfamily N-acetyltransferase